MNHTKHIIVIAVGVVFVIGIVLAISLGIVCGRNGQCGRGTGSSSSNNSNQLRGSGDGGDGSSMNPTALIPTSPTISPVIPVSPSANTSPPPTRGPTTAPVVVLPSDHPTSSPTTIAPTFVPTSTSSPTFSPPLPLLNGTFLELVSMFEPSSVGFARFGESVALDGDILVVGADGDGDGEDGRDNQTGLVYVYQKQRQDDSDNSTTWEQIQILKALDGRWLDGFGKSVAINNKKRIVVGAPYCDPIDDYQQFSSDSDGCVYIFSLAPGDGGAAPPQWEEEAKLVGIPDNNQAENFGFSVAIDNDDTLVVGAPERFRFHIFQRRQGAVQVHWPIQDTFDGPYSFGYSVAILDERIVVGAPWDGGGSARVFKRNGNTNFQLEQELSPSNPMFYGMFGRSVAIDTKTIVVGRKGSEDYDYELHERFGGAAYVFVLDENADEPWTEEQILRIPGVQDDYFGESVAIQGDHTILVGAPHADSIEICFNESSIQYCHYGRGSAYIFTRSDAHDDIITNTTTRSSWKLHQQLSEEAGPTAGSWYGYSVAMDRDVAVVGIRMAGNPALGRARLYAVDSN